MRIHSYLPCSEANGPGKRFVLWAQGCVLACPGCWNADTHDPSTGVCIAARSLSKLINAAESAYGITGLTLTGGEPMYQPWSVLSLVSLLKLRSPDFSIGMFTGHSLADLESGRYSTCTPTLTLNRDGKAGMWRMIKRRLDWAVMGRYVRDLPYQEGLLASRNQKLELFSDRHSRDKFGEQRFEMHIGDTGVVQVTGFPPEVLI